MTGRQHIADRVRGLGFLPLPLAILGIIVMGFSMRTDGILWFALAIGILVLAVVVGFLVSIRIACPFCSQWIGQILRFGAAPFVRGISRKVRYCPLCGAGFDKELETKK
jgi:hypothetical protein